MVSTCFRERIALPFLSWHLAKTNPLERERQGPAHGPSRPASVCLKGVTRCPGLSVHLPVIRTVALPRPLVAPPVGNTCVRVRQRSSLSDRLRAKVSEASGEGRVEGGTTFLARLWPEGRGGRLFSGCCCQQARLSHDLGGACSRSPHPSCLLRTARQKHCTHTHKARWTLGGAQLRPARGAQAKNPTRANRCRSDTAKDRREVALAGGQHPSITPAHCIFSRTDWPFNR